jgi:hypothetical protein
MTTEHKIKRDFSSPQEREDGVLVQLQEAHCSCGWETAPMSMWELRQEVEQHEAS